jgi:hypothetical protein
MMAYVTYRLKRRWLKARQNREFRRDNAAVAKARAEGASVSAIRDLQRSQWEENRILDDEITQLESRYICKEAYRLRVPVPERSDGELWEESFVIGGWQLTDKGFSVLRSDIRKEKNERWQYWELRTKIVVAAATALTGLVGALIGWAAIWK